MSTTTNDPLAAKAGESIQDHKARVMEASRAHAEAQKIAARATTNRPPDGFPKSPNTPSNIPEFMKNLGVQAPVEQPVETVNGSVKTPTSSNGKPSLEEMVEPEWKKVVRAKGWKTPEDALRSGLELEREFHRKNQELAQQQRSNPVPAYVPPLAPPQYATPYPQYQPPTQVLARQLGGKYGIPAEDSERLLPYIAEVAQAAAENALILERARTTPVIQNLQRDVERNKELNEVANDPAMRVPRVQFEVNKLLSDNPSVFAYEPQPLRWALDRALRNIAQESLRADQNYSETQGFPVNPPVTAGSGSQTRGQAPQEPSIDLAGSYFKLKTAQEKRDFLKSMGVAPE